MISHGIPCDINVDEAVGRVSLYLVGSSFCRPAKGAVVQLPCLLRSNALLVYKEVMRNEAREKRKHKLEVGTTSVCVTFTTHTTTESTDRRSKRRFREKRQKPGLSSVYA